MRLVGLVLSIVMLAAPATRKQDRAGPIYVHTFSAPSSLSALGSEISRATAFELKHLQVEVAPAAASVEGGITGRLEVLPAGRVRLSASFRGSAVEVMGDLEHLDDMVHELAGKLGALIPQQGEKEAPASVRRVGPQPREEGRERDSGRPRVGAPPPREQTPSPTEPPDLDAEPHVPESPDLATSSRHPPEVEAPREPAEQRVRVAVNIVGQPVGPVPPAFYGMGLTAQHALISYLQRHAHVIAVPTRLVGLVGGEEASQYSQHLQARYTLMARFNSLAVTSLSSSGYGMLALTGHIHIVLLRDGRPRLDRSFTIPPTPFTQSEPPSNIVTRAVNSAMETIASDLRERLGDAR